jgi:16S rRNA C1402 (ribose-2'-O) methylase RsmI
LILHLSKKRVKKRFEGYFLRFVTSSFGALPNKSITNLTKMIETTKNTIGRWRKKLVATTLKGSFMICVKANSETLASNKRRKKEKDSDEDETNEDARKIAERLR